MSPDTKTRRRAMGLPLSALFLIVALVLLAVAAAAPAGTARRPTKPVIGKPSTVPAQPVAGKRFAVSFKVTRSDTGTPLLRGRMICDPSVAGQELPHAESFRAGTARLGFVVPANAAGKVLKVKVTIKAGTQSATKVAAFRVLGSPALSIGSASVSEGNAGTTTLSFPVRLSAAAASTVSVAYATADGTATAPSDYLAVSGRLTFGPGETVQAIAVAVVGDTTMEQDEAFTVTISQAVNATIAQTTATGTITNDDTAVPVTPGSYQGATQEGNYIFFTVTGSRMLTGLRINALPCRCEPGARLDWAPDFGDAAMPIRADGAFAVEDTWTGSDVAGDFEWTYVYVKIAGRFDTATAATGTIVIKLEFKYKGTHYRCSSGDVRWSATLQS